jgi:FMN phosphatase YigB (HAD superfamily)
MLLKDIPKPEETGVKILAFDQGGIYIKVDYDATVRTYEKFGAKNVQNIYSQANQKHIIDLFERGKCPESDFYQYLRKNLQGLRQDISDEQLYAGWNDMLAGVIPGVLEFIKHLRSLGYITIVVSNGDIIHHTGVEKQLAEAGVKNLFDAESFNERYISYKIGFNKPYTVMFKAVEEDLRFKFPEQNISSSEILFIDDSEKHIKGRNPFEGAENAGWQSLFVPSNLPVESFAKALLTKLKELKFKHENA